MISVGDGDPPPPLPMGPSGSVSVSESMSGSGFVHIILVVVSTTSDSVEENVEWMMDGRLRIVGVNSALATVVSLCGLERVENEVGDNGGETKTVYRRANRMGVGGEGYWLGIGVK